MAERARATVADLMSYVPDALTESEVMGYVHACAETWDPDARILGNLRAKDLLRAVETVKEMLEVVGDMAISTPVLRASPALLESLLAVEFAGNQLDDVTGDDFDCCPNCGAALGSHHTPGCQLRDALDQALGMKSLRAEVVHG